MGMNRAARLLAAGFALAALAGGCSSTSHDPTIDGVWHQLSAAGSGAWCKEDLIFYFDGTLVMQQYECSRRSDTGTWSETGGEISIDFDTFADRSGRVEGRRMTLQAPGFPELVYLKR